MKMKLGNQATTLAAVFCFLAMIVSTIFSGLVIVKLLKKDAPKHIMTLDDLRANPELKIIVLPNSYIDDLLEVSPNLLDIKERIEYQRLVVLKHITNEICEFGSRSNKIDTLKKQHYSTIQSSTGYLVSYWSFRKGSERLQGGKFKC